MTTSWSFRGETSGGIAIREMSAVFSGYRPPCIGLYTIMWMLRALWLVVAYDLSEYRYIDEVTGNLFSLFWSTWRAVLKMFLRLFRIKASESLEKSLAGPIYKEEKWRNWDKKSSWPLNWMPKLQEIFTTVAIVCHVTTDSLFCKMFSPIFCL